MVGIGNETFKVVDKNKQTTNLILFPHMYESVCFTAYSLFIRIIYVYILPILKLKNVLIYLAVLWFSSKLIKFPLFFPPELWKEFHLFLHSSAFAGQMSTGWPSELPGSGKSSMIVIEFSLMKKEDTKQETKYNYKL